MRCCWHLKLCTSLCFPAVPDEFHHEAHGRRRHYGRWKEQCKMYVEKQTGVTFKDVAGQDEAKDSLQEVVDFLHNPGKYTSVGAKLQKEHCL